MVKNDIIEIGNALAQYAIASYEQNKNNLLQQIVIAFSKIGELLNGKNINSTQNDKIYEIVKNTLTLDFSYDKDKNTIPLTNFDNRTKIEDFNLKTKENEDFMKIKLLEQIKTTPNCRIRSDGRFEWRKTIAGIQHNICDSDPESFIKKLNEYKKQLKKHSNNVKDKPKISHKLIDLLNDYCNRYKQNISSINNYKSVIKNQLKNLTLNIECYTKSMIVDVLNKIKAHRMAEYAFNLLKNTFADAAEGGLIIKFNPIANLKKKDITSISSIKQEKGRWFTPEEQSIIYNNRHLSKFGNEIEFFLMVGCRLSEAFTAIPDWNNKRIYINRTKRDGTAGYVPLSDKYCNYLKQHWHTMFKHTKKYYGDKFGEFLTKLGIQRQTKEKPIHRLRHTFATNLYYLGIKDSKARAYLLGHKTTRVTDDIYTDFDPAIKKENIIDIYGDLYPDFN